MLNPYVLIIKQLKAILYASAGGNNYFFKACFTNNKAEVGGIIYNINGRDFNQVNNFNTNFTNSYLSNN